MVSSMVGISRYSLLCLRTLFPDSREVFFGLTTLFGCLAAIVTHKRDNASN